MDTGRIEQADTANVIFDRPATPYVARFMGGQNVLTGTVQESAAGLIRLRAADGSEFETKADGSQKPKAPLSVAVRRDRVSLQRAKDDAAKPVNSVAGVVTATEYQGSYVKVTLDVGGQVFVANVPDRDYFAEAVDRGDAVLASWKTEDVHILGKVDSGAAGDPYLEGGH
jgi:putative spermidine/putrescine transport system ATP-binding protein